MILPTKMHAVTIARPEGPDALAQSEVPMPQVGPGEVLIRVAAAGVNYPDVMQRQGRYDPPPGHSPLPGLEIAGEIAELGPGVAGLERRQQVVALSNGGGYAEYVAVAAGQVLPLPQDVGLLAGGALPETFFTIEQTLVQRSGLRGGMSVLIHGAAGGIGSAAIRIALALGARPIAVVSTREKADYARLLGAKETIDHTFEDFAARARALTEGQGVDRIVSISGGEMIGRNLAALAVGGTIVQLAARSGADTRLDLGLLLSRQATIFGSTLRPQPPAAKAAIAEGLLRDVWPKFADGTIGPGQVRSVPLSEASRAHAAIEERRHLGKLVLLTPWGESVVDKTVAPL